MFGNGIVFGKATLFCASSFRLSHPLSHSLVFFLDIILWFARTSIFGALPITVFHGQLRSRSSTMHIRVQRARFVVGWFYFGIRGGFCISIGCFCGSRNLQKQFHDSSIEHSLSTSPSSKYPLPRSGLRSYIILR
ncbi:hypothetical protein EV421DRAFT_880092 [Armillaria borealis]|uniref:Uncharacterized protein n=1 Tax=Armillaria borealis TaxID=47425 RepID=A0AA39IC13_9AGAR|nr:hypothetical protein EV421DRAFT_880092 [Armillaria borealis]